MKATIVWLRRDLRLEDNPALLAAVERGEPVVPAYVWAPHEEGHWAPGPASRWWLHHSLAQLNEELRRRQSRLVIRRGDTPASVKTLIRETGADAVFWNRSCAPGTMQRDADMEASLRKNSIATEAFDGALLFEPSEIYNQQGRPFRIFTAFWKACLTRLEPVASRRAPARLKPPASWPRSLRLDELSLLPKIDWTGGIQAAWTPGEKAAKKTLTRFLDERLSRYDKQRDRPDLIGTSRLSPYLHWGQISPRQVWHAVKRRAERMKDPGFSRSAMAYLRQLGWREFAYYLLYHFPHTADEPLYPAFTRFPWSNDAEALRTWQKAKTGYPLVDAGMRELWQTGWMHNRVRMVVASFLVKHLLIPWQEGAKWFWKTLVDADLANNTLGWQWTAGCGADAAPYFRVFNPAAQGAKFDPDGDYVRHWVPELASLPARWIHKPFAASPALLADAGVKLGQTYPKPIVDHVAARTRALAGYATMRKKRSSHS